MSPLITMNNLLLAAALTLGMLVLHQIGRRYGQHYLSTHREGMPKGIGPAEGAVFTILGLIMAFSFSGAAERFEERRNQIAEEANAIGTAYLRLDLLPSDAQPELRALFRRYVEVRANLYRGDRERGYHERMSETVALQSDIWRSAVAAGQRADAMPSATMLLLPALNEMIDISAIRDVSRSNHPPDVIFQLLGILSLIAALLVGFNSAENTRQNWFHTLMFCCVVSVTAYVIVDLEYPRIGFIRIEAADAIIADLMERMR